MRPISFHVVTILVFGMPVSLRLMAVSSAIDVAN
jgi:hypothetical protein